MTRESVAINIEGDGKGWYRRPDFRAQRGRALRLECTQAERVTSTLARLRAGNWCAALGDHKLVEAADDRVLSRLVAPPRPPGPSAPR